MAALAPPMITPSLKKEVLCVIVMEDSATLAKEFATIYDTYLDPIIRHLRTPVLNTSDGQAVNTKVTPLVRLGLVFYSDYTESSLATVDRKSFISDYRLYRRILTQHQFSTRAPPKHAVAEGLVAALELFDNHQGIGNVDSTNTIRHCILVASTPHCTDTVRNNISEQYDGFDLARVTATMKDHGIRLSLLATQACRTSLEPLPTQVASASIAVVDGSQLTKGRLIAKLTGLTPPSFELPVAPTSTISEPSTTPKPTARSSTVASLDTPTAASDSTPPLRKKTKVTKPSPNLTVPATPSPGLTAKALKSPTRATVTASKRAPKAKSSSESGRTPKTKARPKPPTTSMSPNPPSLANFSPNITTNMFTMTSPLVASSTAPTHPTLTPSGSIGPGLQAIPAHSGPGLPPSSSQALANLQQEKAKQGEQLQRQIADLTRKVPSNLPQHNPHVQKLLQQLALQQQALTGQPLPLSNEDMMARLQSKINQAVNFNSPGAMGSSGMMANTIATSTPPTNIQTTLVPPLPTASSQSAVSNMMIPTSVALTPTPNPVHPPAPLAGQNVQSLQQLLGNITPAHLQAFYTQPAFLQAKDPEAFAKLQQLSKANIPLNVLVAQIGLANASGHPQPAHSPANTTPAPGLLATREVWSGQILWTARDRVTARNFEHHCNAVAFPGSARVRQTFCDKLKVPDPHLAKNAVPPQNSPFRLQDFQVNLWPQQLQALQLVTLQIDQLLRYIIDKNVAFVEFDLAPNKNDPNVQSNYNALLGNLAEKQMGAFIQFAIPPDPVTQEKFGILLIFHERLLGVLSLNTPLPIKQFMAQPATATPRPTGMDNAPNPQMLLLQQQLLNARATNPQLANNPQLNQLLSGLTDRNQLQQLLLQHQQQLAQQAGLASINQPNRSPNVRPQQPTPPVGHQKLPLASNASPSLLNLSGMQGLSQPSQLMAATPSSGLSGPTHLAPQANASALSQNLAQFLQKSMANVRPGNPTTGPMAGLGTVRPTGLDPATLNLLARKRAGMNMTTGPMNLNMGSFLAGQLPATSTAGAMAGMDGRLNMANLPPQLQQQFYQLQQRQRAMQLMSAMNQGNSGPAAASPGIGNMGTMPMAATNPNPAATLNHSNSNSNAAMNMLIANSGLGGINGTAANPMASMMAHHLLQQNGGQPPPNGLPPPGRKP
ncbi:hypothetical protein H4R34_001286 [Dimargaris verticillata]|uniref:Mediator of RNA polymerase II transcription subunit 25 n=1 Tax=Dimargaris verticillata TaxID=2761393 RepID=A0A9W8EAG0_9FUNG|nr:hypothetical protein H4R34_001286 [Dimargaris verticillata]